MRDAVFRAVLVLIIASAACNRGGSQPIEVRWDASSGLLPDQTGHWKEFQLCPGPAPEQHDGFLRINSLACRDISNRIWYACDTHITMPRRFVLEARLRVTDDLHDPFTRDRSAVIGAVVAPDKVCHLFVGPDRMLFNGVVVPLPGGLQTQGEFHDYRLEVEGSVTALYVDGNEIARAATEYGAASSPPSVFWGDVTRTASGTSDWAYVRHNAGATD